MSSSSKLATVYATDENIAVRSGGDYTILAPEWQKVASAVDGAFAVGDPWRLTSATVDFVSAGIQSGHVVLLRKPNTAFKGSGELLAVSNVSAAGIVLRRLGSEPGLGQPPSPASGLFAVDFLIATLGPQIEEASFDLNRRFGIDPNVPGRSPGNLNDLRDLRQACVLLVLAQRYTAETRSSDGDFALKLARVNQELTDALARLQLRWGANGSDANSSSRFTTRIVR